MPISILPLSREHRPRLKAFRCQHPSLEEFLQRFALRHLERDLLSRTFLALGAEAGRIAGYFSLSTASVDREEAGRVPALDRLPRFPVPAVLLARLAVDERAQGQGMGRYLFEEALGLTLTLGRSGPVRFRVLVSDAIDETAAGFYEHFGFVRLTSSAPFRMILDLRPLLEE